MLLDNIRESNPLMRDEVRGAIAAKIKAIRSLESVAKEIEKAGKPTNEVEAKIDAMKAELMRGIRDVRSK